MFFFFFSFSIVTFVLFHNFPEQMLHHSPFHLQILGGLLTTGCITSSFPSETSNLNVSLVDLPHYYFIWSCFVSHARRLSVFCLSGYFKHLSCLYFMCRCSVCQSNDQRSNEEEETAIDFVQELDPLNQSFNSNTSSVIGRCEWHWWKHEIVAIPALKNFSIVDWRDSFGSR